MNWLTTQTFLSRVGKPELWTKVQSYEFVKELKRDFDAGKEELKAAFGDEFDGFHKLLKCEGDTNQIREHGLIRYDDIFVFTRVAYPEATQEKMYDVASEITGPDGRGVVSITQFIAYMQQSSAKGASINQAVENIRTLTKFQEVEVKEEIPTTFLYKILSEKGLGHHYSKFVKKGLVELTEETPNINDYALKEIGFNKIGERWAVLKAIEAVQKPWEDARREKEEEEKKAKEEAKKAEEEAKKAEEEAKKADQEVKKDTADGEKVEAGEEEVAAAEA